MSKIYYKVVRFKDEKLISSGTNMKNQVEYKLNEWTIAPNNTRLFVFDDLTRAESYVRGVENGRIYECNIVGGIKGRGSFWASDTEEYWKLCNKLLKQRKSWNHIQSKICESGEFSFAGISAILTKKVKLTKLIYEK
jgi:hypothetical protein